MPDAQNSTLASEESDDPSRDGSSASLDTTTAQQLNEIQSALDVQNSAIEELRTLIQNQNTILNELKKRSASRVPPKDIQSAGLEDEARVLLKDIQGKIQSGDAREAKKRWANG